MLTCRYCMSLKSHGCNHVYTVPGAHPYSKACANIFSDVTFKGRVRMTAVKEGLLYDTCVLDHSTREGRNEVRIFVHFWLERGIPVMSEPVED